MDLELSGRVAVVTGASKGIGLAVARTLADEGAYVVAASRTQADVKAAHVAVDLMDPQAPEQVIARAVEEFGGVDILVNNAGGPPPGVTLPRVGFMTPGDADWQAMFEFNLFAVVRMIRAAVPVMIERGGGSIINISTGSARQPGAMNVDYGAAKAALNHVSKAVSEEFGARGIRVNTIAPGPVLTDWWTKDGGAAEVIGGMAGASKEAVIAQVAPDMMRLVTGRLVHPQEIADMVALLASPRSASTTGAEFAIDGGFRKEL
ncbi:NAD(P)-dependent dehydrogenase (short-subunit alcohol dehydrogenase family) [Nonomuraea polychroma]|uniref:NAD(P)-dependent dehydrogenase (Short-subunit alcohol dehydrogenase family) n=1 Tax=Nonomuraea polychroma TaxID=46176 RepID=A0A438MLD3_9ACTN|nr:SDR family NAD(P)-dependent oxidoreductase [Nonomuraea polychroma]RVX46557.1 NAD(P)-dependent dehydrogenase (short-subunit alcohol dehydrogenase family) [Nonomuraea polychroma]